MSQLFKNLNAMLEKKYFAHRRELRNIFLKGFHLLVILSMILSNFAFFDEPAKAAEAESPEYDENPPANDDFDSAVLIDAFPFFHESDTALATTAADDPVIPCFGEMGSKSVWFEITPAETGMVNIDASYSDFEAGLALWAGERGELTEIICNSFELQTQVLAGETYWLEIVQLQEEEYEFLELDVTFYPANPPDNDDFDDAAIVDGLPSGETFFDSMDTSAATTSYDDPVISCIGETGSNSVWYEYAPSRSGILSVYTGDSDYDTVIAVWEGERGDLWEIGCNVWELDEAVEAGQTYWIEIVQDGEPGGGNLELEVWLEAFPSSVVNDEFNDAIIISNLPFYDSSETSEATTGENDPVISCVGDVEGNSVWYGYLPSTDEILNLSTEGSDYDTVLAVWVGDELSLLEVACNDDGDGIGLQSSLQYTATLGTQYWFEIVQYGGEGGGQLAFSVELEGQVSPPTNDEGETFRISVNENGIEGNDQSLLPAISGDGRFVAFLSSASNLVTGDVNDSDDVFVYDRATEEIARVSVGDAGQEAESWSDMASISADGRFVVFRSHANNLVSPDTGWEDVFIFDIQTGDISIVNSSSTGDQGNCWSGYPAVSANGDYVAFWSCADNLVPDISGDQLYWRDRANEEIELVSLGLDEEAGNASSHDPAISGNGRYVAFHSFADNLVFDDSNGQEDVFVRDVFDETTVRASVSSTGVEGNGGSFSAAISEDGQFVAFVSSANNLVDYDGNGVNDIFIHNMETGETRRMSVATNGAEGNGDSSAPAISSDGRYVVFSSSADNLVSNDTNGAADIFIHDRITGVTRRLSRNTAGLEGNQDSQSPAVTGDGRFVAFYSYATNLVANDDNAASDVFVRDLNPGYLLPPVNDDFDDALPMGVLPFSIQMDISAATTAVNDPENSCTADMDTHSVWFRYAPLQNGAAKITTIGSDYDTVLSVWSGEQQDLIELGCNNIVAGDVTRSELVIEVSVGTTYWIEVAQDDEDSSGGSQLSLQADLIRARGLLGTYFDNPSLSVPAIFSRYDPGVNFDWEYGSPGTGIGGDQFSVRWQGAVAAEYSEAYTFYTLSDDGVRLWVDDVLVIDNWTVHGPTWNNGTISLEAGQKYPIKMEYYEEEGGATAILEWSSPSTSRQAIPAVSLSYPRLSGSVIETGELWWNDGEPTYTITIQVASAGGLPVSDVPVFIQVSGKNNFVDGAPVSSGAWVWVGDSDVDGYVSALLASSSAETKTILARLDGVDLDDRAYVTFPPGELSELQLLLPGESPTPGEAPGKVGAPPQFFTEQPMPLVIRAVDENWDLIPTHASTLEIETTDLDAEFSSSIELTDGETVLWISWMTEGTQVITVTDLSAPDLVSTIALEVNDTLIVSQGETITVDDDRYAVTEFIAAGTTTLPLHDTVKLYSGHEILIIAMLGEGIGTQETAVIESITGDNLVLAAPLLNSFDGVHDRVMIQRVPYYPNLIVENGGKLSAHAWDGATGGVVFFRAGDVTVDAGGIIDAGGLGFRVDEGPGSGSSDYPRGGGGHGGLGGGENGGQAYGNVFQPSALGSAGGWASSGSKGGGIIHILVENELHIDGTVAADALQNTSAGGGGAGGSVWLETETLSGTGVIQANGRHAYYNLSYYGSGSGGRIAAYFAENNFAGTWQAVGGTYGEDGSPGTIFLEDTGSSFRKLLVDNQDHAGPPAMLTDAAATAWEFDQIELLNNASFGLLDPDDSMVLTPENMAGDGSGQFYLDQDYTYANPELAGFGLYVPSSVTLTLPDSLTVRGTELTIKGYVSGLSNLMVLPGDDSVGTVRLSATGSSLGEPVGTYTFAQVLILDDQWLELENDVENKTGVTLVANEMVVDGRISADGLGYASATNGGPGQGGTNYQTTGGGGHGGYGGGTLGGTAYGSVLTPDTMGSAGGGSQGGNGGGTIRLVISNTLTVDGIISANGAGSGAGGAGGSIWLEVGTIAGNGLIQANGGGASSSSSYGNGSGGRIAIYFEAFDFGEERIEALGRSGGANGGAGTIYLENGMSGFRKLLIKNQSLDGPPAVITSTVATTWDFDQIELLGNANLEFLNPADAIILTSDNMAGDGSGQLILNADFVLALTEIQGFGLQVPEGITITLPGDVVVRGVELSIGGTLEGASNLTLAVGQASSSVVHLSATGSSAGQNPGTYIFDRLDIQEGQVLMVEGDPVHEAGVTIIAQAVNIEGIVSADGLGYRNSINPGPGAGGHTFTTAGGGGHGGRGGEPNGGLKYGSADEPLMLGSAGGDPDTVSEGGNGGGAIRLIVTDTVHIDGVISANGADGIQSGGGGAGGSIWIAAGVLDGSGVLRANGGDAGRSWYDRYGAGGGGRIAIYAADLSSFSGTWETSPGTYGTDGEPGTIYVDGVTSVYGFSVDVLPDHASSSLVFVTRGTSNQIQIVVENDGLEELDNVQVTPPPYIPWVAITPASVDGLALFESTTFTTTVSAAIDQPLGSYRDSMTVTADLAAPQTLGLTVRVIDPLRPLSVTVRNDQEQLVPNAVLTLVKQEISVNVTRGITQTYHEQVQRTTDSNGVAHWDAIEEGVYEYTLVSQNHETRSGEMAIVSGSGAQLETLVVSALPDLRVTPETVQFGVVRGATKGQTLTIANLGAAPLTGLMILPPSTLPWVYTAIPNPLPDLAPGVSYQITLFASPPTTQTVGVYQDHIRLSAAGEQVADIPIRIEVASDATRNIQITAVDQETEIPITSGGKVILTAQDPVTMTIEGQEIAYFPKFSQSLDENGIATFEALEPGNYSYQFRGDGYLAHNGNMDVQPGDGTQAASLSVEPDYIHYDWEIAYIDQQYVITLTMTYDYVDNPPPVWCEEYDCEPVGGGLRWVSAGPAFKLPPFIPFPSISYDDEEENRAIAKLELSQDTLIEGEGFTAGLSLSNNGPTSVSNVSVDFTILGNDGTVDRTSQFTIMGDPPLPGTLGSGQTRSGEWFILPTGLHVTDEAGENFVVYATITWEKSNGEPDGFETYPYLITVYPPPDLVLSYELPAPDYDCILFDLKVTIENQGIGPARNLHFNTATPVVVSRTGGPVSFEITSVTINDVLQENALNLDLGYIPPGESVVVTWRLLASSPGKFIEFEAEYKQVDYHGLQLTPFISEVNTALVDTFCVAPVIPGNWPWSSGNPDPCIDGALPATQGDQGGPINTRTGAYDYSYTDISVPTLAGELAFQRWYASEGTAAYTSTLGYGWTHNLDARLIFPEGPHGEEGKIIFKAFSANCYEYRINDDGTFSPYPGMCGSLTRLDGSPAVYVIRDNKQRSYSFDADGRLIQVTSAEGHSLYYAYDGMERLELVRDESGTRYLAIAYDLQGRIGSVSDHTGRQVSFGYDAATGDLISATDVLSQTWAYHYEDPIHPHYLTEVIAPRGITVERTEFDSQGRAVRQYNGADVLVVELIYNSDGTTTILDGLDHETIHNYDKRGTLTSQANAFWESGSKSYDRNFRPTTLTDANGNSRGMTWSADGTNIESLTNESGDVTTFAYDDLNNVIAITDTLGNRTSFVYSGTLLLSSTDALGNTTQYTYTTAADWPQPPGLMKAVEDPSGQVTSYIYDASGQRVSITDAAGNTTRYGYDELGRIVSITDSRGKTNWTCFDAAGRIVRMVMNASGDGSSPATDPCDAEQYQPSQDPNADRISTILYDPVGNRIATIDERGRVNRTYYDSANRQVAMVQNLSGWDITQPALPPEHLRTATQNLTTETVYDLQGNVIASIGVDGLITRTYYDSLNRPQYITRNLTGWEIEDTSPPPEELRTVGQNLTTETVYDPNGNVIATIGPDGIVNRTYYDELNRPVSTIQNLKGQEIAVATPPDRNPSVPSQNLRSDTVYDANSNIIATIDPAGKIIRTYYDELNQPIVIVQNLAGQAISESMPPEYDLDFPDQNVRTETVYDDSGRAIASIDTTGKVTRTYFDGLGRPTVVVMNLTGQSIVNPTPPIYDPAHPDQNVRTETVYDEKGQVIASLDPLGRITRTYYDDLDRPYLVVNNLYGQAIAAQTPPVYNPDFPDQNLRIETVYDANGLAIATIDPMGRINRTYYDELDRPYLVVHNLVGQDIADPHPPDHDPAAPDQNLRMETLFDESGRAIAALDTLGRITRTYFDDLGRSVLTVRNLVGQDVFLETQPVYDPDHPDQNVRSETVYGLSGRVIARIDPLGVVSRTYYDDVGRVRFEIQNLVGQDIFVETPPSYAPDHPDQNLRTEYKYDIAGNRIAKIDGNGVETLYEYDGLNRLQAVVENYKPGFNPAPDVNVRTEYGYDGLGNLVSIRDANAVASDAQEYAHFGYDGLNRKASKTDPLGHTTVYRYDAASQQTSLTDANGKTTYYHYDGLGRQVIVDYPDPDADVTFTYNAAGQTLTMTDGSGLTAWEYDPLGLPITITHPISGTVGYRYDSYGNRAALIYPDGKTVSYVYDGLSRLSQATDWEDRITSYAYDAAGQLRAESLPNGVTSTYAYNPLGWLTSLVHANGDVILSSFEYQYDAAGNRIQATESMLPAGGGGQQDALLDSLAVRDEDFLRLAALLAMPAGDTLTTDGGILLLGWSAPSQAESATLRASEAEFAPGLVKISRRPGGMAKVLSQSAQVVTVTVSNTDGIPEAGLTVYAFNGATYTGVNGTSDANGQMALSLPEGSYRFRADKNGTQFWSAAENHCELPGCTEAAVTTTLPVAVTVQNTDGQAEPGLKVYAFKSSTYTGYNKTTDANGEVFFTLPQGEYRFRADKNGTQFWSSAADDCAVPGCTTTAVTTTVPVVVTVSNTGGSPEPGLKVYAFNGTTYTGYNKTTDGNGQTDFTLPQGNYRFRADKNGTQFWSGASNHCTLPGCTSASITVPGSVVVTVQDTGGALQAGLAVYVFNGSTYTNFNGTTDANGQVAFTLPDGSYRFRADKNGTQFWSAASNHCDVPGCGSALVTVSVPLTVTVRDHAGHPQAGLPVYVFDGDTYTNYNGTTDANGQTDFTLPQGIYRFRVDKNGTQFWSGAENHCTIPGCTVAEVTVTGDGTVVTVLNTDGVPEPGLPVYVFNGTTYTNFNGTTDANGQVAFTLPEGEYRFRADKNGTQFWSGAENHCSVPACTGAVVTTTLPLTVNVQNTDGQVESGLKVYVFNGATYTNYNGTTNENGQTVFTLPMGEYRFRADKNGTHFWSGAENHCSIPGCITTVVTTTIPLTVTVQDTDGQAESDLKVYVFNGTTYTNYNGTTDESGQAVFTLPIGEYRFRVDKNGTQFWSGVENHCALPGCLTAVVTTTVPVTVTVLDTNGTPENGLKVYAFDGVTYTNYNGTTDGNGQADFTLPQGAYRFRVDKDGTQFWSSTANDCAVPGCTTSVVTTTIPLTVTVKNQGGAAQAGVKVYAFDGSSYTNYTKTTEANGQAIFTLPAGNYRFRADSEGMQSWSGESNHCAVPGCLQVSITVPGGIIAQTNVITYEYDALYRLTDADYLNVDTEEASHAFSYTYDSVGNRLTKEECLAGFDCLTNIYSHDAANRIASVDGVAYTWDANGNLIHDGEYTYSYNAANQLISGAGSDVTVGYVYNGLGDRTRQTITAAGEPVETINYTLDLALGLTQVLEDGERTYVYGVNRVAQWTHRTQEMEYFQGDALGSVRQLTDAAGVVTLSKSYQPYGTLLDSGGAGQTNYGFAGEWTDVSGLIYLRARYYSPEMGSFFQVDPFPGYSNLPITLHPYQYALNNPILYLDPSGESILGGILIAGGAGLFSGMIIGVGIGCLTYEWAIAGMCGCDAQEKASSMSKEQWIGMHALFGGIMGGVASALAAAAPLLSIVVGSGSIVLSVVDFINTLEIIKTETGITPCTIVRLVLDTAGVIFGVGLVNKGMNGWLDSGKLLYWRGKYPWRFPRTNYDDGGNEYGMMKPEETEFMRAFAMKRGKPVDICGGFAETVKGMENRYIDHPSVPDFRRGPLPTWNELDVSEVSGLTEVEIVQLREFFGVAEMDVTGYSISRYGPGQPYGSIRFNPDGTTTRILGPWQ